MLILDKHTVYNVQECFGHHHANVNIIYCSECRHVTETVKESNNLKVNAKINFIIKQ